ncbi:hypothetical protein [Pantoea sp. BAV 3049]|uniref:hypothetical protein n=1 Tax=Pantoea sp. BAV 3049 TaxID=2654188 RepID=UPI00131D7F77|nr:hypothetical protein [Pantoea sp. BAV 3049]
MNTTESFTPDYVLHLQGVQHDCCCCGCHSASPLLQLRWKNQVRHSAVFGCDQVARTILFQRHSLSMHIGEAVAENLPELNKRLLILNHSCLRLLEGVRGDLSLKLYTLGLFIMKAAKESPTEKPGSLVEVYLRQGIQRRIARAFEAFSSDEEYKIMALRTLSQLPLEVSLDPLSRMVLQQTLQQMAALPDEMLQIRLNGLEKRCELAEFLQAQQTAFINFLLYQLYHNVFPGHSRADWTAAYAGLCQHFFCLKMLCALSLQQQLVLDEENISALFAAWHRVAPRHSFHDNPLLAGISLLK